MDLQQHDDNSESKLARSVQGDLDYNDLLYRAPENLSLRVHRTQRQMKADRTSYNPSETCTIRLNTGSDYIDPKNSYLAFSVAVNSGTANFGIGSALNLINQVVVRSKSGVELDRFRRVNLYKSHSIKYEKSRSWMVKQGTLMGYADSAELATNPATGGITTTAVKYLIPLCELAGVFDPCGSAQLMPATLASGLEVELTYESLDRALVQNSGTSTTYTITNPEIHVEAIRLTESTQRVLNDKAAKEGLSYMYYRYHTSEVDGHTTSITHRISLSVAQCVEAMAMIIDNAAALATDNNASKTHNTTAWYTRIGQLYYPATTLADDSAGRESYFQALKAFNKLRVSHAEGAVSRADFAGAYGALCMAFNKDENLLMSGEAINNSRQLEYQITRSGSATNEQHVVFVKYLAQARCFLDSVVVGV